MAISHRVAKLEKATPTIQKAILLFLEDGDDQAQLFKEHCEEHGLDPNGDYFVIPIRFVSPSAA